MCGREEILSCLIPDAEAMLILQVLPVWAHRVRQNPPEGQAGVEPGAWQRGHPCALLLQEDGHHRRLCRGGRPLCQGGHAIQHPMLRWASVFGKSSLSITQVKRCIWMSVGTKCLGSGHFAGAWTLQDTIVSVPAHMLSHFIWICRLVLLFCQFVSGEELNMCENTPQPPWIKTCAWRERECVGMAGDRGMRYPELTASSLQHLDLPKSCTDGYSSSRTCEMSMSNHSGIHFRGLVYLVDEATKPKQSAASAWEDGFWHCAESCWDIESESKQEACILAAEFGAPMSFEIDALLWHQEYCGCRLRILEEAWNNCHIFRMACWASVNELLPLPTPISLDFTRP